MDDKRQKEDKKTISIIIATYNADQHLKDCLHSILSQPFKNLEIIIVDGGSTDNTIPFLRSLHLDNLTWITEPDRGIYDALNKGTGIAGGKWFYFLGSDDRLLDGFSELAAKLEDEKTVYYGNSESYYTKDTKPPYEILTGRFSRYRLSKYCLNHQAILYPSAIFSQFRYHLPYRVFADYALNLQVWGNKRYRKKHYPISIVRYNMNGFSSLANDVAFRKDKPRIIRQNMGWFIYLRFLLKRYKKRLLGETGFE